jgi:hypothetical protein
VGDFDALLLAVLAVIGLAAGLALAGVLVVKVDLKRPTPTQPRRRKQTPPAEADAERDPWDPDEPPF